MCVCVCERERERERDRERENFCKCIVNKVLCFLYKLVRDAK